MTLNPNVAANPSLISSRHVPALDGVRGLAMLMIMVIHLFVIEPANGVQHAVLAVAHGSWVSVELFFALSGFLITGILLDNVRKSNYFSRFYIRRIARIFPLFYAVTIFSFVILPHIAFFPPEKLARFGTVGSDQPLYWLFLSNFAIAKEGVWRHGIMDVTWSLAIEEQFYATWPLVIYLFRKHLLNICIALFIISFALRVYAVETGMSYVSIYVLPWFRLEVLLSGAFLAALLREPIDKALVLRWSYRAMLIGATGFLACCAVDGQLFFHDAPHVTAYGFAFLGPGFGGVIGVVYLNPGSILTRFFNLGFPRFIGKISFALYLFHLPIRAAVRDLWITPEWIGTTPFYGLSGQLVFYLVAGSIAILAAYLSYSLFEKHITKWGVRVTRDDRSETSSGVDKQGEQVGKLNYADKLDTPSTRADEASIVRS